jgi:hypothetical protein
VPLNAIPTENVPLDRQGKWKPVWQAFLSSVHDFLSPLGQSGTSTTRPTDSSRNPLYIGQPYFDTTINKPIWVKSKNPTVWCDATGTAV